MVKDLIVKAEETLLSLSVCVVSLEGTLCVSRQLFNPFLSVVLSNDSLLVDQDLVLLIPVGIENLRLILAREIRSEAVIAYED